MAITTINTNPAGLDIHTEKMTGIVQSAFYEKSMLREKFKIHPVINTNVISKRRIGKTTVVAVQKGVETTATTIDSDKLYLKVEVAIMARQKIDFLDKIQNDFSEQTAIGENQGKELAREFDKALLTQVMKGSRVTTPPINGFGVGNVTAIVGAQGHLDPIKIADAIDAITQSMEEQDVDVTGSESVVAYLPPAQYHALVKSDVINRDYGGQDNGSRASGTVRMASGVKIYNSNSLPTATVTNHVLGSAYNVSASEAKCVGLVFGGDALFVGESVKINTKVWFRDSDQSHYIDSTLAFNAVPDRLEHCGVINRA